MWYRHFSHKTSLSDIPNEKLLCQYRPYFHSVTKTSFITPPPPPFILQDSISLSTPSELSFRTDKHMTADTELLRNIVGKARLKHLWVYVIIR
jgi:hypothetical protein